MKIFEEALPDAQLAALKDMGSFATEYGFYLAGGTALALLLGHRQSVDLDWFTEQGIGDVDRLAGDLARHAKQCGAEFSDVSISPGTIYASVRTVRVSMMEYRYPQIAEPVRWGEANCLLASLDDIACMKLSAIGSRGSKKDFIDLYALLQQHAELPALLDRYRKKYPEHSIAHTIYSLSYFDDAEPEPMPSMIWDVRWKTVKETLLHATKILTQRKI